MPNIRIALLIKKRSAMTNYLRFMVYNRCPQLKPLRAGTLVNEALTYEQGKVYRLRLIGSTVEVMT